MKKLFILLTILFPILLNSQNLRIAILDLQSGVGVPSYFGADVAELIRTEMINLGKFIVLERSQMQEILKEQEFQLSGCTETECAVQVGQLLSANKVLIGKISKFGDVFTINVRIVDVEKGVGEFAESIKANSEREIPDAIKILIEKLSARIERKVPQEEKISPAKPEIKPWTKLGLSEKQFNRMIKKGGNSKDFLNFKSKGLTYEDYIDAIENKRYDPKSYLEFKLVESRDGIARMRRWKSINFLIFGISTGVATYSLLQSNKYYNDVNSLYSEYKDAKDSNTASDLHNKITDSLKKGDNLRTVMYITTGCAGFFGILGILESIWQKNYEEEYNKAEEKLKLVSDFKFSPFYANIEILRYSW